MNIQNGRAACWAQHGMEKPSDGCGSGDSEISEAGVRGDVTGLRTPGATLVKDPMMKHMPPKKNPAAAYHEILQAENINLREAWMMQSLSEERRQHV